MLGWLQPPNLFGCGHIVVGMTLSQPLPIWRAGAQIEADHCATRQMSSNNLGGRNRNRTIKPPAGTDAN